MMSGNIIAALASILIANGTGLLSSFLSGDVKANYALLRKPIFSPPDWIFGVVWPILFVMMGYAAYQVWVTPTTPERRTALALYGLQLLLNFSWSIIFFRFNQRALALAVVVLMAVLVGVTALLFGRIHRTAGWLMLPYLFWLCFAAYLNAGVVWLNRG